jgi:hypothetical protein
MAAEREVPPREVPELGHGPLRAPALPDLDINQTALADTLARHPLVMQRLTTWLKAKSDPDPGVQARNIVSFLAYYGADSVTIANLAVFGRVVSLLDAPEPVNAAKLANIAESFFHDVLRDDHSEEASRAARLPKPAMAVLAIFNILSANPMVTTLDAVLDAFRPPERERDRVDKRPAPPDDHEDLADRDRDAGREARQSTRLRKNMPTQEWRGPRAAAVTAFVKQNGPLPAELADYAGHPQSIATYCRSIYPDEEPSATAHFLLTGHGHVNLIMIRG